MFTVCPIIRAAHCLGTALNGTSHDWACFRGGGGAAIIHVILTNPVSCDRSFSTLGVFSIFGTVTATVASGP